MVGSNAEAGVWGLPLSAGGVGHRLRAAAYVGRGAPGRLLGTRHSGATGVLPARGFMPEWVRIGSKG